MNQVQAAPDSARPPRRSFKSLLWGSLVLSLLMLGLYTAFMLWFSYSEGERAGVLQKVSKRGWVCKTYEGELALYVVGGVAPQIWHFSVRDEAIAAELRRTVGQQVRIHYEEHRGLPTDCFGETDYFASGFEVIGPAPSVEAVEQPPPPPAPDGSGPVNRP